MQNEEKKFFNELKGWRKRNNLFLSEAFKGFSDLFLKFFVSVSLHFIFSNFVFCFRFFLSYAPKICFALILNLYLTMCSPFCAHIHIHLLGLVVCFALQFVMFYTFYCFSSTRNCFSLSCLCACVFVFSPKIVKQ